LYWPASHAAQTGPAEVWPALHTQSAMDALVGGECELLWHCTHCVLSSAEYEPGAHSVQGSAEAPTAFEWLPAAHGVHTCGPALGLYLPGTHAGHRASSDVCPALQKQLLEASLPSSECAPVTHDRQRVRKSAA